MGHFPFIYDPHDIFHRPELISDARSHGRRQAQGLMDADEILMHEVDRQPVNMVLDFLGECVRLVLHTILHLPCGDGVAWALEVILNHWAFASEEESEGFF